MVVIKYFRLEIGTPLEETIGGGKEVTIRIITGTRIVCNKTIREDKEFDKIIDHCIAKAAHELKEYIKELKEDEYLRSLSADEMKDYVDHQLNTCVPMPMVTRSGPLDCQVCVPDKYDDDKVLEYANCANPCGTTTGWHIRKQGDEALRGAKEREICSTRKDYVHIMLDA